MNFVFLSPQFPPSWYHFAVALAGRGVTVLGLGDADFGTLRPELQRALAFYQAAAPLESYDVLLRACGSFTHRFGKLDRIESFNEHWLELEAGLRTDFNVPGIGRAGIDQVKKKSAMKEVFRRAGLTVARGARIRTRAEAEAFVAEVGFPVVAKPDCGVGAAGTFRLEGPAGVEWLFQHVPAVDYFLEEFVDGPIVSFDGLTGRDGRPVFVTAHQYCDNVMEVVLEGRHTMYYSLRDLPLDLEQAGLAAVAAFGCPERFFHLEFFRRRCDGALVALEINMRPPGGMTTDMFNYACDADIYGLYADLVTGRPLGEPPRRRWHCGYLSRRAAKAYTHGHDEVLRRFGPRIAHHGALSEVFRVAMGDYGYLARTETEAELLDIKAFVHAEGGEPRA